jgi:predicted hydrolase (HD superfamily)
MALSYQQARDQLAAWTRNPSLVNHARAVEIVMRRAAARYGQGADEERWAITGLLHDADYDQWPEDHPRRIAEWLRGQSEEDLAYAVLAHNSKLGHPPQSALDKALVACDELAGCHWQLACQCPRVI